MLRKLFGGLGFILLLIGVGCVDSPSMLLPGTMIFVGLLFVVVAVKLDTNWSEK